MTRGQMMYRLLYIEIGLFVAGTIFGLVIGWIYR